MQLKILNPYKNQPNQSTRIGETLRVSYYDIFHNNEILFNYVINKLYQLKDKEKSDDIITSTTNHLTQQTYLFKKGMNHLMQMQKVWGLDNAKAHIVRNIWEKVCRCDSENEWKIPHIKSIGKHKYLKKVLSKNYNG